MFAEIKQHLIDLKEEIRAIKVNQTEGRVIFDVKQQLKELKEEIKVMNKVAQAGERVFGGGRCFKIKLVSISLWQRLIDTWIFRNQISLEEDINYMQNFNLF